MMNTDMYMHTNTCRHLVAARRSTIQSMYVVLDTFQASACVCAASFDVCHDVNT